MTHRVAFEGREISVASGQSLLDALVAAGIDISNGCRTGVCQSCLLRVTEGAIPRQAQTGLSAGQQETGHVLACQTFIQTDMALCRAAVGGVRYACHVLEVRPLSETVFRLRLSRPENFDYRAGQYVTLWRDEHNCRAFSLVSLPDEDFLEFHVRRYDGGYVSPWLCASRPGDALELQGPMGSCVYATNNPEAPLLLAGNGVGLAPLWGIVRNALAAGHLGSVHLLHGVSEMSHAYLDVELRALAQAHTNLHYNVVTGSVSDLAVNMLAKADSFFGWKVFLCGAPETVSALRKHLFLAGAASRDILSDAFVVQ